MTLLLRLWARIVRKLEHAYNPRPHIYISREHMYDLNAAANRNYWYDMRGNRWPLRNSL
jgi:hypothetical protein